MPIYEYGCDDCGRVSETLQRIGDPPLTECPHCGGRLHKRISAPAFQFKGSGWYVTDYARQGGGDKAADGGGDGKGEAKGEGKGEAGAADAKPAAAGDAGGGAKKKTAKAAAGGGDG